MEKVVLGLSDGVDSAVAARVLMDRGYEVHGVYLDIAGADARADALASAERLGDEVIGMHEGIHHYTVGQRWPELWHERRLYVSAIHAESNELELCLWDDLFRRKFDIANLSFVNGSAPGNEFRAAVRVRHTRWETPACTVTLTEHGAHVVTDEPVRAPAPGQAAALYDGERLLGGGYIV